MQSFAYPAYLTTAELADYLRVGERTVYELVRRGQIPCSRAAGKLLFPRQLVDLWVEAGVASPIAAVRRAPPLLAGSHDPLLEWALRESGCGLALLAGGSADGLRRISAGEAAAAALHILDPESGSYNERAVARIAGLADLVLIEWAWRQQGLVVPRDNPERIARIADLVRPGLRVARRQEDAGAQMLLRHLVRAAGLSWDALLPGPVASTETDLAALILDGKADAGLAVEAVARRFRLGFVPLHRERLDLAVRRREFFEAPFQRLLAFSRTAVLREQADVLGGYDVSGLGTVVYNA
jgi:excisionase family DNA binding protein